MLSCRQREPRRWLFAHLLRASVAAVRVVLACSQRFRDRTFHVTIKKRPRRLRRPPRSAQTNRLLAAGRGWDRFR